MCGLVGMMGFIDVNLEKVFKQMLVLDVVRGPHSTGVVSVNGGRETKIAKAVGTPHTLMDTKSFDKALGGCNRVLIGHNRHATVGGVNVANAHPFDCDSVVGAHNGTLRNKIVLKNHSSYHTDSEALFDHIHHEGIDDAVEKVDGAYALTWWDKDTEELNIIRNKERPLYLAYSECGKVVMWASEPWMIHVAINRISPKDFKIKQPFSLPEMELVQISYPEKGVSMEDATKSFDLSKKEYSPPPKLEVVQNNNRYNFGKVEDKEGAAYKFFLNTKIDFFIDNLVIENGVRYYRGTMYWLSECYNVRVYCQLGSNPDKLIGKHGIDMEWSAFVVGHIQTKGVGNYLRVNAGSLELVTYEDEEEGGTVKVDGEELPKDKFKDLAEKGCAWCGSKLEEEDAEDSILLHGTTGKEIICGHCKDDPFVTEHVGIS